MRRAVVVAVLALAAGALVFWAQRDARMDSASRPDAAERPSEPVPAALAAVEARAGTPDGQTRDVDAPTAPANTARATVASIGSARVRVRVTDAESSAAVVGALAYLDSAYIPAEVVSRFFRYEPASTDERGEV